VKKSMTVIPIIIEQHAEEAAFLWLQRDAAVREPHYDLDDLAKLDDRVEAHIDGLRISGEAGWDICKQALKLEEPGEVFAASVLAFERRDNKRIDTVIAVGAVSTETWRGLVSALGWLSLSQTESLVSTMLSSEVPEYKRLGIAAGAIHRQDPGAALVEALKDPEPRFQARALRAVGELKRHDLLPVLQHQFQSDNTACRFWAAWSSVLLGDSAALEILKAFATKELALRERAIQLIFRVMDNKQAQSDLTEHANQSGGLRHAVIAAGVAGDPGRIPWLIDLMSQPEQARVAGEAFSMITGVDIAYEDLEGEWPEGFEAGPTENPEDEDVEMDPDEDLPWPNPELISDWWNKNKGNFKNGTRYLVGKPIIEEHCQYVLRYGYQRQRAAAALELAIMNPGTPLFNVCAPGFRQQQLLGLK
jgi:uncharacterized protein (TIGR02270 family)